MIILGKVLGYFGYFSKSFAVYTYTHIPPLITCIIKIFQWTMLAYWASVITSTPLFRESIISKRDYRVNFFFKKSINKVFNENRKPSSKAGKLIDLPVLSTVSVTE